MGVVIITAASIKTSAKPNNNPNSILKSFLIALFVLNLPFKLRDKNTNLCKGNTVFSTLYIHKLYRFFTMEQLKYILAIESSCDDTGAAVLCNDKVLSNVVAKQEIHELYGGVIPELASRAHQQNIVPVVDVALQKAGIQKTDLSAIAFT